MDRFNILLGKEGKKKTNRSNDFLTEVEKNPDRSNCWAAPVDTREELISELERQMRGEKDKHDRFIEDYLYMLNVSRRNS